MRFSSSFYSLLFLLFFLSGCGYVPISMYTKESLGDSLYVSSRVSLSNPENSVLAKDALNYAITTRFQANLVDASEAKTIIEVDMRNISISSIGENDRGFTSFYRASVSLRFSYNDDLGKTREFINTGVYDFSTESLSTISDEKKFSAINEASLQAIDKFIIQAASRWR